MSSKTSPSASPAAKPAKAPSIARTRKAVRMADDACPADPDEDELSDLQLFKAAFTHSRAPRARMGMFVQPGKKEADFKQARPLLHAAVADDIEALKDALARYPQSVNQAALSDKPADKGLRDNYSPLHMACYNDSAEAVALLMEAGADSSRFLSGVTPVGLAAYSGAIGALKALCACGADAHLTLSAEHGEEGSTLLHRMMERSGSPRRHEVVRALILSGQYPDPFIKTAAGRSPIDRDDGSEPQDRTERWLLSYAASLEALALSQSVKKSKPAPSKSPSL